MVEKEHRLPTEKLVPPDDPRTSYDLPPLGTLTTVTHLDELVTRVVAPNASSMTLDGTNTYVIGSAGTGVCVVVDPGPNSTNHFNRVESVIGALDAEVAMVLVTHHHKDHSAAALTWAEKWGCSVAARSDVVSGPRGLILNGSEESLRFGSLQLEVVATPGHCSDHIAFRLENGVLLTGDLILGRGTALISWPEGDLILYIESLRKTLTLAATALYPGHGPHLVGKAPEEVINFYLAHRAFRELQILSLLGSGPKSLEELTELIYLGLPENKKRAAHMTTRACLDKLQRVSEVEERRGGLWILSN